MSSVCSVAVFSNRLYRVLQSGRQKSPRPSPSHVGDLTHPIDQIQPLWPRHIRRHHRIVHVIDVRPNPVRHRRFAFPSRRSTSLDRLGIVEIWSFPFTQIPAVDRMRFPDINHEELDLLVILRVKIPETDRLANERRSGETTEHECNRLHTSEFGQPDSRLASNIAQLEIRCSFSHPRGVQFVFGVPDIEICSILYRSYEMLTCEMIEIRRGRCPVVGLGILRPPGVRVFVSRRPVGAVPHHSRALQQGRRLEDTHRSTAAQIRIRFFTRLPATPESAFAPPANRSRQGSGRQRATEPGPHPFLLHGGVLDTSLQHPAQTRHLSG